MTSPSLDDLSRRLVDLADSAGPWDDPLPEIRRRAAGMTTDSISTEPPLFRPPASVRRPRGRLHSVNMTLVASAAAVVALVAGVGFLIHSGGSTSDKKVSAASGVQASTSAAAGGSAAGSRTAEGRAGPATASLTACGWPAPTSAVTLRAPASVRSGASVSVGVRLTGRAAADVYSPLVVVLSQGRVVGRLVPNFIPPGPSLRPSSPTATSTTLTGTLRRSTCAEATSQAHRPQVPRGLALPPGRYQLIAVATAAGARVVSASVAITVIR